MHTVIHAVIGYVFLVFVVRGLSRRPGAQMTPFEFVIIFLIGGVIILTTVGDDHSEINSVCAVMTIALMHRTFAWLRMRFPKFGKLVDGTPLIVLQDGQWNTTVMNQMRLQDMDVMAAARNKGVKALDQIKYAILERNGAISIIKKQES